jgi:hypothetical protein
LLLLQLLPPQPDCYCDKPSMQWNPKDPKNLLLLLLPLYTIQLLPAA